MIYPGYCWKCGQKIEPTLEGLVDHIRSERHNRPYVAG